MIFDIFLRIFIKFTIFFKVFFILLQFANIFFTFIELFFFWSQFLLSFTDFLCKRNLFNNFFTISNIAKNLLSDALKH